MEYYNDKLKELQEQVSRKKHLTVKRDELQKQYDRLKEKAAQLEAEKVSEQADVERLEARSLANFFYQVVGKMDEKLSKEKEEAYAAAVKYDAAVSEMKAVKADINSVLNELGECQGCDIQYARALEEKTEAVRQSGTPEAEELLQLEQKLTEFKCQEREIREALSAGNSALCTADCILESLKSAENWGTWDLLGGGLISDIAKHSHLDAAQSKVERLQTQLGRLKTELADVTIQSDVQVSVDGFMRFADYFYDGLFADWAVLNRIDKSSTQISQTRGQINAVVRRLETLLNTNTQNQTRTQFRIQQLILNARF